MTSHFEGYAHALYQQKIHYRREKRACLQPKHNNKCRLCKVNVEDITHVIFPCPNMSARYQLPTITTRRYCRSNLHSVT